MGCLYIGGAQCVHAQFLDGDDWEQFDKAERALAALAAKFDLHVNRYNLDDQGDPHFVLSNAAIRHECFYEGAAFETDMSIPVSETFAARAQLFAQALNADESFSAFHGLAWSDPKVLYFVTS